MDDLAGKLNELLNSPEGMARIQNLANMLGQNQQAAPAPMLAAVRQEDDSTRLLRALRPLLGEERQKKLDEAIRILQFMRMLPMLRQSGLLSGLL